ncbi:cell wall-associated NlpC family hydrolase [Nocardiopsis sp. Huas11]|uniref:C40 family peptidase n=1 Tax=Nocardiopsis sp. Huas11 TaxID=2183912 RepID=UPI000F248953|nr:C40 family peptidase [Nocardiopsis sp. Huas11]RKS06024.1 cell wall-associated NlpC family hydrolase [Nocardiopsis sp. Huas11]
MLKLALGGAIALLVLVPMIGSVGIGSQERQRQSETAPGRIAGIPDVLMDAYVTAAARLEELHPGCTGMTWAILAGIGREESDHAAGHTIAANGDTTPPIIGPLLNGTGVGNNWTPHHDTDDGRWDSDTTYDAAVGVTQLLPAWWADRGVDGNDDGEADPHNVYDATAATTVELCTSHPQNTVDFTDRAQLREALYRYNPWDTYVDNVLSHIDEYTAMNLDDPTAHQVPADASERGRTAAEWGLAQVGKPYVWGGTGPHGFDCSGLTMKAWEAAGVSIPRVTTDQVNFGTSVTLDALAPGDLLFYDTGGPGAPPAHVTMYVGDGKMVNAPSTGKNIRVEPVNGPYYSARFMSATRPG